MRFWATCLTESLSHYNRAGVLKGMLMFWSKHVSYYSSQTVEARVRYSAFAEDLETVDCFFDSYEIRESPRNIQKPVVESLVPIQVA